VKRSGITPRRKERGVPAGAPPWVTAAHIDMMIETFQPHYADRLTRDDAVEMIRTFDMLFELLESK